MRAVSVADLEQTKAFLRNIPIFGGLQDPGLEKLIRMMEQQSFKVGTVVAKQGESGRSMYIVRAGELIVKRQVFGGPVRVVRIKPGDFFGETTLIEIHPMSASVVVEQDATLYRLTNRDLYRLYQEDPQAYVMVVMNLSRELCRRLRKAEQRIAAGDACAGSAVSNAVVAAHASGLSRRGGGGPLGASGPRPDRRLRVDLPCAAGHGAGPRARVRRCQPGRCVHPRAVGRTACTRPCRGGAGRFRRLGERTALHAFVAAICLFTACSPVLAAVLAPAKLSIAPVLRAEAPDVNLAIVRAS
jgi:CRP-like cAMP-binding protein